MANGNAHQLEYTAPPQAADTPQSCAADAASFSAVNFEDAKAAFRACLVRAAAGNSHQPPAMELTDHAAGPAPAQGRAEAREQTPEIRPNHVSFHGSYQEAKEASRSDIPLARMQNDTAGLFGPTNTAVSKIGAEIETRAFWHGDRHALTPMGLGSEGCMLAASKYAIGPALEARGLTTLGGKPADTILDSHAFLSAVSNGQADHLSKSGQSVDGPLASVSLIKQGDLKATDLQPGDIVVGVKPTAAGKAQHVFDGHNLRFDYHTSVATRIPANWGNYPGAMMLVGNTGLDMTHVAGGGPHDPGRGPDSPTLPHFRTAQEVIGANTEKLNGHHGQLNSQSPTNPYLGGYFYIVRLHDQQ